MMKIAGLIAAVLAAWHLWSGEYLSAGLWVLAVLCLTLGELWWRSARSAWRG
jgi:hypothetical protein